MKLKREFLIGVGSRVRFWEDGWCGPNPLCNIPLVKDSLVWKRNSGRLFSVRSYFDFLEGDSNFSAPAKIFWNFNVPSEMGFFVWKFWWENVLTMNQLKRRGFPLASRCPLCGKAEEDVHHQLIHCTKIWELWGHLLSCVGTVWVCPLMAWDLLSGCKTFPVKKTERKIWLAVPLHLFWAIWNS